MTCRLHVLAACAALLVAQTGCRDESNMSADERDDTISSAQVVRLSEQSQAAVGLSTQRVQTAPVRNSLRAAGWLETKPDRHVVIRAPATGFFVLDAEQPLVEIGSYLSSGQPVGGLQVVLSPQEEAQLVAAKEEADVLINQSQVTLRLAEEQLERLRRSAEGAVAGTRMTELEETVERARVAYKEARERLPFLPKEPYGQPLQLRSIPLASPISGQVRQVDVVPRQFVVQGDPLATVEDWSILWVQVPIFVDDLPRIRQQQDVEISLGGEDQTLVAHPVPAPQAAEPGRRTIDLLYEVANQQGMLRPGQAVSVELPTSDFVERFVVPRAAIVWDALGNAWVYVRTGPESFRRQRVELGREDGENVSVARGLKEAQEVVTVGAESLYGEEFQDQISVEDDD